MFIQTNTTPDPATIRFLPGHEVLPSRTVEFDDDRYFVPTAVIGFEPDWTGPGVEAIADALLGGDPPIYVKIDSARRLVEAFSANLQPGEPEIIGQRLREVLTASG